MSQEYLSLSLRLLGSGLVFSAGFLMGNFKAREMENEASELKNLETALLYLSAQISYALSPLPSALEKAAGASGGAVKEIFLGMAALIGLSEGLTPKEALEEILSRGSVRVPLSVKGILEDLTRGLGTTGHKEQIGYIDGFIQETRVQKKQYEERADKKGRLLRYTGALFAIALIILLI